MRRCVFGLLVLGLLLVSGCDRSQAQVEGDHDHDAESSHAGHGHEDEHGHGEPVSLTNEQAKLAGLQTESARLESVQSELTVPGHVVPLSSKRAVVTPPVSGRLSRLSVRLGDTVKKGQVLGTVESTELAEAWARITSTEQRQKDASARLKEAQAEAKITLSAVQFAERTLIRQKEFARAGAFNTAALQQAQRELNEAQSDLLSAQKELSGHQEVLQRLENLYREGLVSKSDLQAAQLEVQKDEIEVARAESATKLAKSAYAREKNIADQGLLNSKELQSAEADVSQAKLGHERAKIAVASARSALTSADKAVADAKSTYRTYSGGAGASGGTVRLIAPMTGVVAHLDVTQGQAVDRTQVLCEIENLDSVWVTANVPEQEVAKLKVGATVIVVPDAFPGTTFEGVIQVIGAAIDPKTRSIPVQCLIENNNKRLKPEMFAQVRLAYGSPQRALTVSSGAVVDDGGKSVVFVKEHGEFFRQEVQTGLVFGDRVEIHDGIKSGQTVVSEGGFILKSQLAKDDLKGHEH